MSENILKTRVQQKIDTSANWASSNLILKDGEIGIERTTNNKIKIKIGDGINTWANLPYATSENSSPSEGGINYEAGDGIDINDNIISSSYGKLILQSKIFEGISLQQNANSIDITKNFLYESSAINENFKVNEIKLYISVDYFSSIIKPLNIILKKNNETIKTINISLGPQILWENTENEMSFPYAAIGNKYFAQALISKGQDTEAITALMDENNPIPTTDWWTAVLEDQGSLYLLTYQAHEDILPLDIDAIDLELQIEIFYKLPNNALTAGNGIKISEDATIGLNYGQSTKKIFNPIFNASFNITPPSNYYFGNLYGYFIQRNNNYALEPNTYPNFFAVYNLQGYTSYDNNLIDIVKNWKQIEYKTTIDYNNDEYKLVPLYYYKNDEIPSEPNIILTEMQYQDNALYSFFEAGLDNSNPTKNIFFSGTYNTSQDANTILSNAAIIPTDPDEPALLILFLYQSNTNQIYLIIFTNNTNFDTTTMLAQGTWNYEFNHLPYAVFNGQNNTNLEQSNDSEAFIIGNNNQYRPGGENKTIIVGNNNNMANLSFNCSAILLGNNLEVNADNNQIIIGQYNSSSLNFSGKRLFIIGNGSGENTRSNVLEVTSNGLNVNGDIHINGQNLDSRYISSTQIDDFISSGSSRIPTSNAVYNYVQNAIQAALNNQQT